MEKKEIGIKYIKYILFSIGINIGVSATMFNNNFMDSNEESISENELQLITSGISLNNIYLKKGSAPNSFLPKMIYRLIPNTISFQMTSRILYYEDISNNSTSKSVYGVKAEYNKPFNRKNDAMYFFICVSHRTRHLFIRS